MFLTDKEFEAEITKIALLLWPSASGGGPTMLEGKERDGVYVADEFVNAIECTLSRRLDKADDDGDKLSKLCRRLEQEYPTKHVKGWFITKDEPTPEQRHSIVKRKEKIVAVSYEQFRAKLVDASTYLTLRREYPFGSVRDPESGASKTTIDYVQPTITSSVGSDATVQSIAADLAATGRFILMGDYGAGKSSTLKEIFEVLAKSFWRGETLKFPIMLNLRDHHGQTSTTEALERHARNVGFESPSHLVRAWRAGYVILMLDGFDEIATAGWAGRTKKLKDLRFRSMELVRGFVRDTPGSVGLVVAGREHFFDTSAEREKALGQVGEFTELKLSEFSDRQIKDFLSRRGLQQDIPSWLPARPLLLAYLSSRNLLREIFSVAADSSAAVGWNSLLERVSERESEIEAGIDSDTVRLLIENLATLARRSADGLGPISQEQIVSTFTEVCGYAPDDRGAVLLQRLPGLGGNSSEDGSRSFVDKDFAESAAAGTVYHFVEQPFHYKLDASNWQSALTPVGAEVSALRCRTAKFTAAKIATALREAATGTASCLAADIFSTLTSLGASYELADDVYLNGVVIPEINLDGRATDLSRINFQDCIVGRLIIDQDDARHKGPRFQRCYFTTIEGRIGPSDLPAGCFDSECTFDEFEDSGATTKQLLALSITTPEKVLLTVLKKLYAQSGRGRKEAALFRGLDAREQAYVSPILGLLKRDAFIVEAYGSSQRVYVPTRSGDTAKRALRILAAPASCGDPLLKEVSAL